MDTQDTPTPTDPREEQPFVRCCDDIITDRETKLANLAAEIAELKERESKALDEARHWHQRLVLTDYAILGNADAIRRLCEEDAEFKAASQIVSLENARALRAELEAARKEREDETRENEMLRAYAGSQMFYSDFPTADDMRKALNTARAAKDAAEKRVAELAEVIEDAPHGVNCMGVLDDPEFGYYRPENCTCWKRRALTPAPTQEPPAGGVTISNETVGIIPTATTLTEASPDVSTLGAEAASHPSNSPADVPSEGRGELLPFNLSDALAGKPVVTRDGSWRGTLVAVPNLDSDIIGDYVAIAVMTAGPFLVLRDGRLFNDRLNDKDLFMLPPEGSGA